MATNPTPNVGSGPNKENGVPPDNGSLKTTAQKAKDAINDALKSNSELLDMLLESGRKLTEAQEKFETEQRDADQLTRQKAPREGENLRNIFWVAIAGLLLVGISILINRRIRVIKQ